MWSRPSRTTSRRCGWATRFWPWRANGSTAGRSRKSCSRPRATRSRCSAALPTAPRRWACSRGCSPSRRVRATRSRRAAAARRATSKPRSSARASAWTWTAEAAPAELPEAAPALIDSLKKPARRPRRAARILEAVLAAAGEADLTGYGAAPFCSVVASWTRFAEKDPTAQVVEIVANENLNARTLAALKGEWSVAGTDGGARLVQDFSRREYGGQPTVEPMLCERVLSFVGESLSSCARATRRSCASSSGATAARCGQNRPAARGARQGREADAMGARRQDERPRRRGRSRGADGHPVDTV